ncbi:MAG: hypothetical protein LBQ03_02330 [Puniceicoccales bacterium]|jgi:hypothetical protein|nr:hypothetical protein [Puniceicoccales bacterium]
MGRELYIILGLGLFNVKSLGDPNRRIIQQVQILEKRINSGKLNDVEVAKTMEKLFNLSFDNFDSLPKDIKGLLDEDAKNDIKKSLSYNILRLYAFPNDPTKIGNVMDDLLFRTEDFANNADRKQRFFDAIKNLNVGRKKQERFREIIDCQETDVT